MNAYCNTCRFWREFPTDDRLRGSDDTPLVFGACRRTAPTFDGAMYTHARRYGSVSELSAHLEASSFPWTRGGDWCGQHQPNDKNRNPGL